MSRIDNDLCAGINCSECCGCATWDIGYQQGKAYEREKIVKKLEEKLSEKKYQHDGEDYYVGISEALEIVRGGENG